MFMAKNKACNIIDVFGLAASLTFVILIAVYTVQEESVDRFHLKADRIFALGNEIDFGNAYRIADRIRDRYPEIEKVCPLSPIYGSTVLINEAKLNVDLLFVDTTFFEMFDFRLQGANPRSALAARNQAVISRTFALKAFGNKDPMGQTVVLNKEVSVVVNGIMDDIGNSAIPCGDILLRIDNIKHFNSSMDSETFDNAGSTIIFILEKQGARLSAKAEDMAAYFKEIYRRYQRGMLHQVSFTPLKEVYFSELNNNNLVHGDRKLVRILTSAGLLILIFALINYINLTVAQAGFRAKEMAMRRLLGSTRSELFLRLILESILLCFISFLIALVLATQCAPYAGELLDAKLNPAELLSPGGVLTALGTIILTGVIAGSLPAYIISNVKPLDKSAASPPSSEPDSPPVRPSIAVTTGLWSMKAKTFPFKCWWSIPPFSTCSA